jgi:hypothetical protein
LGLPAAQHRKIARVIRTDMVALARLARTLDTRLKKMNPKRRAKSCRYALDAVVALAIARGKVKAHDTKQARTPTREVRSLVARFKQVCMRKP